MKRRITSHSPEATAKAGADIAKTLYGGTVIALSGDLGAGKTVFAKGVAAALGIADEVTSPTFTLVRSYIGKKLTLHHFDAYRLGSEIEAEEAGLTELIGEPDSISVIEWPERIAGLLPLSTIRVKIINIDEDKREIEIGE